MYVSFSMWFCFCSSHLQQFWSLLFLFQGSILAAELSKIIAPRSRASEKVVRAAQQLYRKERYIADKQDYPAEIQQVSAGDLVAAVDDVSSNASTSNKGRSSQATANSLSVHPPSFSDASGPTPIQVRVCA